MNSQVHLFHDLLIKTEKYLAPIGIWPNSKNSWITIFNTVILFGYSILVLIKNLHNPEKESVENAITLANGDLATVVYFVTVILKRKKFERFLSFIKSEKFFVSDECKKLLIAGGKEYQIISTAFLYVLSAAILVRFIQPPIQYAYILIFEEEKSYNLPPSMGIPTFLFGDIVTYLLESLVRTIMLCTLMGVCAIFIVSSLYICTQYNILALELENLRENDDAALHQLIENHQELLKFTKLLNEIFSPFFFADCFFSFINLSIMMFSFVTSNARIENFLMETPLVACGSLQLFLVLYFGERLIDATSQMSNAAYKSEWFKMSIKNQKKISLIIIRGQKPQTLNVGGNNGLVASLLLFSQIFQKAYGAFNILRTTV